MMPDFTDVFSYATSYSSSIGASFDLSEGASQRYIYYSKIQFKFKWGGEVSNEDKYPVKYSVIFIPEDDPETEDIDESENVEFISTIPVDWDGESNESGVFEIDPGAISSTKDGTYRLLKVDVEVVDRDDPTKVWGDEQPRNISEPIYAGESTGDMVRWSIGDGSLSSLNFTWTAEGPNGETETGPTGVGKNEWKIADGDTNTSVDWLDWKPGDWKIKVVIGSAEVEFEQEIGVRTEEYFAIGRVTADVSPPENGVTPLVINNWSCPAIELSAAATLLGGINDTEDSDGPFFVPFDFDNRMYVNHQLLNTTSNLPPPIDENLSPEQAFGLHRNQHYRFFVYGHFKFLTDGNEFSQLPEVINKVALVGGTPTPCQTDRKIGFAGEGHGDHGAHRFIDGDMSEFEFIGKVRAGSLAVTGNGSVNGRELPWAFLRLRFNPDDGITDTKLTSHSTDPDGPDELDFSGVPNIVILRRYYDLDDSEYRVELIENLDESQAKREDFFLSGPPISSKPYLLER
jgi:hypothetical protein